MPRIYRTMKRGQDGKPVIEKSARGLGVREPGQERPDIDVDDAGNVCCNGRGMSVAKHWKYIIGFLIPEHLDDGENGACGKGNLHCWRMGEGDFLPSLIADHLELALKKNSTTSGCVTPVGTLPLAEYQAALAATRDQWVEDEED